MLRTMDSPTGRIQQTVAGQEMVARCLNQGHTRLGDRLYDLGLAFSTGSHGLTCDLVQAHRWFNIAAMQGHAEAVHCRADVAEEMTAREIAEAQRLAREWLAANRRKAA